MDRSADNHYPTSETEAICARSVQDIAAVDCALFLWATVPMVEHAFRVMKAWGFEYKSHCIWKKDRIGTGYWFRNQHELLLVGIKGTGLPRAGRWHTISKRDRGTGRKTFRKAGRVLRDDLSLFPDSAQDRIERAPPKGGLDAVGPRSTPNRRVRDTPEFCRSRHAGTQRDNGMG
jgi:N6-adenosine-specific RNA methylase IME4